jgi:hypothetical protein
MDLRTVQMSQSRAIIAQDSLPTLSLVENEVGNNMGGFSSLRALDFLNELCVNALQSHA